MSDETRSAHGVMTEPAGNCPIQSYGTYRGWLLYFRARCGWEFRAWGPGQWSGDDHRVSDLPTNSDEYWSPRIFLDEDAEADLDGFPAWVPDAHDGERGPFTYSEDYPGWWSPAYAADVLAWCVAIVTKMIDEAT